MRYIYDDGEGYALITAETPEKALRLIYQRDLDSEDHEMLRISPFDLTEITLGTIHHLEFTLKPSEVELIVETTRTTASYLTTSESWPEWPDV